MNARQDQIGDYSVKAGPCRDDALGVVGLGNADDAEPLAARAAAMGASGSRRRRGDILDFTLFVEKQVACRLQARAQIELVRGLVELAKAAALQCSHGYTEVAQGSLATAGNQDCLPSTPRSGGIKKVVPRHSHHRPFAADECLRARMDERIGDFLGEARPAQPSDQIEHHVERRSGALIGLESVEGYRQYSAV